MLGLCDNLLRLIPLQGYKSFAAPATPDYTTEQLFDGSVPFDKAVISSQRQIVPSAIQRIFAAAVSTTVQYPSDYLVVLSMAAFLIESEVPIGSLNIAAWMTKLCLRLKRVCRLWIPLIPRAPSLSSILSYA
jgi:hypothetical protein